MPGWRRLSQAHARSTEERVPTMLRADADMTAVEALLAPYSPAVSEVAHRARRLVIDVLPGTVELVDVPAKLLGYGRDRTLKGLICAVALQRAYVNLMFARGVDLVDPDGLLEGTGKKARHVKLRTLVDVERPGVRALLEQAGRLTP